MSQTGSPEVPSPSHRSLPAARPARRPVRPLAVLTVVPLLRWIVAVDSVPAENPRRSACDRCGTPFGLIGPLRACSPLARCGNCGARIGAPPFIVELALLAAVTSLVLAARPVVESIALGWWALCVVPLIFIDVAVHRLPDRLTYPAAAGTWALLGLAALGPVAGGEDATSWVRAVLAGSGMALLFAASTLLLGRRGFGLGDAKLALSSVAILGWLGWREVLFGLMVAFAGSAVTSLFLLAARRVRWSGHVPFGPFLILGTFVTLALPTA
jgi:leader peptidase (prepilin peptidase)/N-methyltransferase